jgi:alpha-D-ribose 1-methylphosphonate 5-triphosphate diphosphatase
MNDISLMPCDSIVGGNVLTPDGFAPADIALADGRIAGLDGLRGRAIAPRGCALDARGLLVLPGIVDIHGDAFERQIQPRPGVSFPIPLAMADSERQLLANGITTAFHSITLSWEPGLRSVQTWRAILDAVAARAWDCDIRIHMRWEAFNLDALETALADIAAGRVHMVGLNDHTPAILKALGDPEKAAKYSGRGPLSTEEFTSLAHRVAARAGEVAAATARIVAAAQAAGVALASHDDATVAVRDEARALGASICEFPMAEEVGLAARAAGDAVVMGSPNVVRGGSHLGWASAARLAEAGICNVLCSDYFYPCLLHAPFVLAARGTLDLAASWRLVSTNPARAAGLADRGEIAVGQRADMVLVEEVGGTPTLRAVLCAGRPVWLDGAITDRMI